MSPLAVEVIDARAEPYAAVPTLMFRLRVTATEPDVVHALALRCQIRIEPQRRRYTPDEEERLLELFGPTPHWGQSLRPFLWTHVSSMLPGFTHTTEIDLPVACSYDFEVSATKYFHALEDSDVPLVLLFNGTVFSPGVAGFAAQPVSWNLDAEYRLPVQVWRDLMDLYFPASGWLRVHRDTLDALQRFKSSRALPTWEQAFETLLKEAGEDPS